MSRGKHRWGQKFLQRYLPESRERVVLRHRLKSKEEAEANLVKRSVIGEVLEGVSFINGVMLFKRGQGKNKYYLRNIRP